MISEPPVNYSSHHSLVHRFSLAVFFLIAVTFAGCAHSEVTAQTSQQPPPPPPPLTFLAEWGTHGHEPGELGHPEWLTTDFTGNAFIADSGTGNIEKFGPTGHPLLSFDDRVPDDPFRVAVDPGGNLCAVPECKLDFHFFAGGGAVPPSSAYSVEGTPEA